MLKLTGAKQDDKSGNGAINVTYFALQPGISRAFLGKGRVRGAFRFFKVNAGSTESLPYEYAEGKQPGNSLDWSLSFDYRASNNITAAIRYTGEKNTRYDKILHNLRAELQVFF